MTTEVISRLEEEAIISKLPHRRSWENVAICNGGIYMDLHQLAHD